MYVDFDYICQACGVCFKWQSIYITHLAHVHHIKHDPRNIPELGEYSSDKREALLDFYRVIPLPTLKQIDCLAKSQNMDKETIYKWIKSMKKKKIYAQQINFS